MTDVTALVLEAERVELLDEVGLGGDPAAAAHADPLADEETHGRPQELLGPMAAAMRLIPARDGALWRRFESEAQARGARWRVYWCPSHLRDKQPPPDAEKKLAKARQQEGWDDLYLDLNKEVDEHATTALASAAALHGAIAAREEALSRAQSAAAVIGAAVAKRLLEARLPNQAAEGGGGNPRRHVAPGKRSRRRTQRASRRRRPAITRPKPMFGGA